MIAGNAYPAETARDGDKALCMRISAISVAAAVIIFSALAVYTGQWAWLVVPAATLFMAGIQGLLYLFFPALRGTTTCTREGCGDAR